MKNVTEWSVEFDLLWNNLGSNKAPGLTSYEKSVALTRAQESVITQLYNGSAREPFESSEEVTEYLAKLVQQAQGELITDTTFPKLTDDSTIFKLPGNIMFRTFEKCTVSVPVGNLHVAKELVVVPVTQDEFWKIRRDPFKRDGDSRVLRLTYGKNDWAATSPATLNYYEYSELVSPYDITDYTCRFIAKPTPIILENLTGTGLSINGSTGSPNGFTCAMPEELHQTILIEAVRLARSAWSSNI